MSYGERLSEAFAYAARLHRDQARKSVDVPYITHLMSVAALVGEEGGSEDEVIAALLHDGPEDQGGRETLEEIRRRFGSGVAEIVESCTDTFDAQKPPWRARKEKYLAHLASAGPSARLVSCADKLHNSRSIVTDLRESGDEVWGRFRGGKEGTLWYYGALVEAFRTHGAPEKLLRELSLTVATMRRLAGE